jgi:hypothetical protein
LPAIAVGQVPFILADTPPSPASRLLQGRGFNEIGVITPFVGAGLLAIAVGQATFMLMDKSLSPASRLLRVLRKPLNAFI